MDTVDRNIANWLGLFGGSLCFTSLCPERSFNCFRFKVMLSMIYQIHEAMGMNMPFLYLPNTYVTTST